MIAVGIQTVNPVSCEIKKTNIFLHINVKCIFEHWTHKSPITGVLTLKMEKKIIIVSSLFFMIIWFESLRNLNSFSLRRVRTTKVLESLH